MDYKMDVEHLTIYPIKTRKLREHGELDQVQLAAWVLLTIT